MSAENSALQQAQEQITDLLEAAKAGSLVPIRLPSQIEAIVALLEQAETEQATALKEAEARATPFDKDAYMQEESDFVGHAVHELNTPLTSIRGYSDMLASMGELNDMQKQFLGVVKNNSQRMQDLLSDFRYLNKLRKETLRAEPKMDMFKNISMKLEKSFTERAEEMKRTLEFDIPSGLPYLNVDTELLGIAMDKIVENALRYTKEGEGVIKISARGEDGYLVTTVEDNGIGMSEEELAQLGTVYFRSDRDEVNAYKGSGLGIPLAFGIVDLIGGEIDVQSEVDNGTTVTIRIKGMG